MTKTDRILKVLNELNEDSKVMETMKTLYETMEDILSPDEMQVMVDFYEHPSYPRIYKVQKLASEKMIYKIMNDAMYGSSDPNRTKNPAQTSDLDQNLQDILSAFADPDDFGDN